MDKPAHSVIILGGGVSGLFTALKLVENGHQDVIILEADHEFGGRVRSVEFRQGIIELGAQWIHGRGDCPLWKFVNDNQIPVTSDGGGDGDGEFYLPGGDLMPQPLLEECLEFSENEEIQAFIASEKDSEKVTLKKGFCDWFLKWELVDTGVDNLKNQSVRSWLDYTDYDLESEDGEPILEGGYSSLVNFLLRKASSFLRSLEGRVILQTNRKVVRVDWDEEDLVRVTTETGQTYTSQYVVVALPLGVLKSTHTSMFSPSLPKQKIEIIEHLSFGVMDKIFLSFETIFWNSDKPGLQFIRTDLDIDDADDDISRTWYRSIAGFDSVCAQPNVLCGWISGPPAVFMESLSDTEILETCWSLLKQFVGGWVPRPHSCTPTRWASNGNSRGSYSYSTPECDRRGIGPQDLAETLSNSSGTPRLFFSGEASEREHYGTVTGAMLSGCREGLKIARILDKS